MNKNSRNPRPCRLVTTLFVTLLFAGLSACNDAAEPTANNTHPFSHTEKPGASSGDFLTEVRFKQLVVEIDYMPNVRPTVGAMERLQQFLQSWTAKNSVTVLDPTEIPSGGQESYSADDIRELEETYRNRMAGGETLTIYCIFVDGDYTTENVLGIAYYNTSCALFGATIAEISGGATQPSREKVESTVLHHEVGHLFGLVDNGLEMQQNHHDEPNGAHCTIESCLMYHAVETSNFFANLFDDTVPGFGEFCTADINAAR